MGCCHSSAKTADEQRAEAAIVPAANGHAALPTSTSTPPTRRAGTGAGNNAVESKSKTTNTNNTSRDASQTRVPGSTLTVGLHEAHPSTSSQPHSSSQQPSPTAAGMTEAQASEALPAQSISPAAGSGGSRAQSLMLPTDHTDMTASGKLRSSLRSTGSQKRMIPPKSTPLAAPSRKLTGSSLASLGLAAGAGGAGAGAGAGAGNSMFSQAFASSGGQNTAAVADSPVGVVGAQFVHSSDSLHHDHAGHHGYGPLAMAAASGAPRPGAAEPDLDASTQLNSDTSVGFVSAAGAAPNGDGAAGSTNDPPIGGGHHQGAPGIGSGRRKKLRRQTSHKGLLSKLALQFPLIKASFQRVHRVFQRYHRERLNLHTKSMVPNSLDLYSTLSSHEEDGVTTNPTNITITAPPAESASGAAAAPAAAASAPPSPATATAAGGAPLSPLFDRGLSGAHHSVAPSIHLSSIDPATASLSKSQTHVYLSEEISLDKLSEVLHHIAGPRKTFSEREVRELFNQADLDGSKTISFREFLIAVSIGYFLVDPAPDSAPPAKTPLGGGTPMEASPAIGPVGSSAGKGLAASASSSSSSLAVTPAFPASSSKPAVLGDNLLLNAPASAAPPSPASTGGDGALSVTMALPSSSSSSASTDASSASASASASSSSSLLDDDSATSFYEIARGFRVVQKAFQDIDEDHSGFVDLSEMKKALFATSSGSNAKGKDDPTLLEARFAELDFNGDGGVNFPEFMYGFVSWVGFNDEEE